MFKKLKQKIEAGEEGTEKLTFSPSKMPGSAVRSPPATEASLSFSSPPLSPLRGSVTQVSPVSSTATAPLGGRQEETKRTTSPSPVSEPTVLLMLTAL